jgi:hypothetical protein
MGCLKVFPTLFPLTQDINAQLIELLQLLLTYKTNRPKARIIFCQEVHRFAAESGSSSLTLRPVISLSSNFAEYHVEAE